MIDLETFEGTLQKMSIGLTKGVAKRYFELFSEGKDRLNVVDLLQIDLNENKEEIKNSLLFKSFMTVKS